MEPTHVSAGFLLKFGMWFVDFAKMPGRIKTLAEAAQQDADKRPICPSCGTGRIGNYTTVLYGDAVGTCQQCGTQWFIRPDGKTPNGIYQPGNVTPKSWV